MAHDTARTPPPPPPSADVVVIGAGVIGAGIAFHLAEAGARDVLVLERDTPAVGEIVRDLWLGREPFLDIGPLSATRFERAGAAARPEAHIS
ncbi:FAD-dependent oxidoreductase [Streptomyces formicae]|uniref:FAD-dependent oxidoreductase n=1 Tax=Streptomyces formicae TaxID=1616117 RepID=A0ABY3WSY1_9ACTN|nr:FAD-dependent oxidoreductase [Streptomyces formicae]